MFGFTNVTIPESERVIIIEPEYLDQLVHVIQNTSAVTQGTLALIHHSSMVFFGRLNTITAIE